MPQLALPVNSGISYGSIRVQCGTELEAINDRLKARTTKDCAAITGTAVWLMFRTAFTKFVKYLGAKKIIPDNELENDKKKFERAGEIAPGAKRRTKTTRHSSPDRGASKHQF